MFAQRKRGGGGGVEEKGEKGKKKEKNEEKMCACTVWLGHGFSHEHICINTGFMAHKATKITQSTPNVRTGMESYRPL